MTEINRRHPTPPESTVSLWQTGEENRFEGKIKLNLFLLKRIERQPIDDSGVVELDISLLLNQGDNTNPALTGIVSGLDSRGYDEKFYRNDCEWVLP